MASATLNLHPDDGERPSGRILPTSPVVVLDLDRGGDFSVLLAVDAPAETYLRDLASVATQLADLIAAGPARVEVEVEAVSDGGA